MHEIHLEDRFAKRSRPLIHALIISVALNLGLLATFITFILKEKKVETFLQLQSSPQKKAHVATLLRRNAEVLEDYAQAPFPFLVQELENRELVEQGYRRCDLALACLVNYHHFDLERSLPGIKIERRPFRFGSREIELIPGLNSEKFQVISYFARFEKWPLTSEGLYEEIKHRKEAVPDTLKQAFCLSQEFYAIERAFSRLPFRFTQETLLHLLLDGNWEQIKEFNGAISPFLARFETSKLAAYLLIAIDPDYPFTQFSDERLQTLIGWLDQKTDEAEVFLNRVAHSLRSDAMRALAEQRLTSWTE